MKGVGLIAVTAAKEDPESLFGTIVLTEGRLVQVQEVASHP